MTRKRWMVVLVAGLGAGAGHFASSRSTAACDCPPQAWRVTLRQVTSSDPAADHRPFWPASGTLTAYPGEAHIWADQLTPGIIARVGVRR